MDVELATRSLTVTTAENWVRRLSSRQAPTAVLDLRQCHSVHSSAGWRVGNALRRLSPPQGRCDAIVPWKGPADSDWFLNYTRSGLGQALAQHASHIIDARGIDVTDEVRKYYSDRAEHTRNNIKGVYGNGHMQTLVPNEEAFYAKFDTWVSEILTEKGCDVVAVAQSLHLLAWEAVTNVVDHSLKKPLDPGTPGLSSLTLRWYGEDAARHAHAESPRHAHWLQQIQHDRPDAPLLGFLDLVISDDGVGMAARQEQDADIYWRSIDGELAAVVGALEAGSTIKLTARDSEIRGRPGLGYTNIADVIGALDAWAVLRTGRITLELDGTEVDSDHFTPVSRVAGYMPGTAVEVRIPIRGLQGQLIARPRR
jgi:hypothetical protein